MRRIFTWFFLCLLGQYSFVIACTDDTVCDHRKYGHRRALLKNSIISFPTIGDLPSCSFTDYFRDHSIRAMALREHLIKTGAFTSESDSDATLRQIACKVLENSQELGLDIIKKVVDESPEMGAHVASIKIPIQQVYHKVRRMAQDIKNEVESKDRNIASFGFVFFDQEGKAINGIPFHFSPHATPETLEVPFFFLSGRRHQNLQPDEPWTALPEWAPKNIDLNLMPPEAYSRQGSQTIQKAFQGVLSKDHWLSIDSLKKVFENSLSGYNDSFKRALLIKAEKEPFFNYVSRRSSSGSTRVIKSEVCLSLLKLLDLPVLQLEPSVHYPKEKTINSEENEEGDFTHSEQYALFQASLTFENFLDACVQRLSQKLVTQASSANPSDNGMAVSVPQPSPRTVGSYAVLLYTYNVMCVRCAQSVIIDFAHTEHGFNEIINKKLNKLPNAQSIERPMVFMAGYTHNYQSELRNTPCDAFEHYVHPRQASEQYDRPCDAFDRYVRNKTISTTDWTLIDTNGSEYETCSPEDSPEMIYHVQIPLK